MGIGDAIILEECSGGGPDERHDALGDHGAIEDGATMTSVFYATRHERRLRGMETADGSVSDGDEHHREDGVGLILGAEALTHLGEVGTIDIERDENAHGHEDERECEERIHTANDLIDREKRGKNV